MILAVNILLMLKVISTVGQHQHGSQGNSLGLDTFDHKTQGFIVSEDDILLEEIIASAKNVAETLFDADVPGKLGITSARTRRRRRQVSQDDIKEALCRDKNPGEFFRLVAGESHCRDVVACADHGLQAKADYTLKFLIFPTKKNEYPTMPPGHPMSPGPGVLSPAADLRLARRGEGLQPGDVLLRAQ